MIEEVEKLETNSQHGIFPTGQLGVLHNAEIRIEKTQPAKVIAPLRESYRRPIARAGWPRQVSSVEPSLASRLNETRVGIGRYAIWEELRRLARLRSFRKRCTFATGCSRSERASRHSV